MEKLRCTSCNGELELDDLQKIGTCIYCGTKYKLDGDKTIVLNMVNNLGLTGKASKTIVCLAIGVFVFISSIILFMTTGMIGSHDVDSYNLEFKYGDGTQNGVFVQDTLNKVNNKNKTNNDHKITVKYKDEETQDENKIIELKQSLKSLKQYEVKYEYDDKGYINKIVIEDIK